MAYKPARLLYSQDFLGKNAGVGSHSPLQSIFLIKGSNLGLLYHRQILYHLSHPGSASHAPGSPINALQKLFHLILTMTL